MISSISKNFEISAKYLLNYYNKFGKVIFLESRVDEIWKRSEIRKENHEGYVYKDLNQIDQEIRNFHFFKSILKNKVDLLSKDNIS